MSFSFDWNLLTITDVVGIVLTALDFLNLTPKLEAGFGKVRKYCERYAAFKWQRAKRNWPPHKHIKPISLEIIDTLPVALLVFGSFVWLSGSYEMLRDFVLALSDRQRIVLYLGCVFAIILNAFLAQYVTSRIIWAFVWSLEKAFMILGLPPKGVTGTIGLIVSVISFTLTHIIN